MTQRESRGRRVRRVPEPLLLADGISLNFRIEFQALGLFWGRLGSFEAFGAVRFPVQDVWCAMIMPATVIVLHALRSKQRQNIGEIRIGRRGESRRRIVRARKLLKRIFAPILLGVVSLYFIWRHAKDDMDATTVTQNFQE